MAQTYKTVKKLKLLTTKMQYNRLLGFRYFFFIHLLKTYIKGNLNKIEQIDIKES